MIDHSRRGFDESKDIEEVDQFGYIDLCQAYATGSVSGDMYPDQLRMNDIEDPMSILGRPVDEFDAVRMNKIIRERGVKKEEG